MYGVILYVSESIDAVQLDKFNGVGFSDGVFCMLSLPGSKFVVSVCYRSPASADENSEAMLSLFKFDDFVDKRSCNIMEDFDRPNVDFGLFAVHGTTDLFTNKVYDCLIDNFFTQHVSGPNILEELQYDVPLRKTDRVCLKWQISFKSEVLETI